MQVDGQESTDIKFRHLPYTIDTDETEMIAIDYVAKGAGSAAAVDDSPSQEASSKPAETIQSDKKGKKRADLPAETTTQTEKETTNGVQDTNSVLSPEEQDQVANLTTRLNSVKMLQSRISLLRSFIQTLPPSYITDQESAALTPTNPDPSHLPHLRNIQALLTRLSLLTPADAGSSAQPLAAASQAQSNDVALASMLALLGQDIQALSELGRKFATVDSARGTKSKHSGVPKSGGAGGGNPFEGSAEGDSRFGGVTISNAGGMMV